MKPLSLVLSSFALVLFASSARADARKACVEAADHGQELRDKGKLIDARQAFVACARDECPTMVARQCTTWLADADRQIPSVIIRARDPQGRDLVEVTVSVDDVIKTNSLDGRPMQLDPGVHKLRFTHASDPPVEQDVVARVGEKERLIDVQLGAAKVTAPPPEPPKTPPSESPKSGFHFPVFAGVMLGVGVASFAGMAALIITTSNDANHMKATCGQTNSCKQSDVDWANTRIILANVAMGVGIAGIGLTVISLIAANVGHSSPAPSAWRFDVGPGSFALSRTF